MTGTRNRTNKPIVTWSAGDAIFGGGEVSVWLVLRKSLDLVTVECIDG